MGNRPARIIGPKTEPLLQGKIVDLVHDPVNVIGKIGAFFFNPVIMRQQASGVSNTSISGLMTKPHWPQLLEPCQFACARGTSLISPQA